MNGGYGGPLAGENGELCNFDRRRPWPGTMAGNDKVMENGKLDPVTPCTLLVRGVSLQVPATLVVWWESLGAFARWVELSPLVCSTIAFALIYWMISQSFLEYGCVATGSKIYLHIIYSGKLFKFTLEHVCYVLELRN